MTIEGLGKKFQEARLARKLTLEEAARMTKIRPSRLAEIEADDFSQFPSLAYAKGFLLIYGKFLDVDVTPYLEAFEGSTNVTVDGYSYLQEAPAPKPARAPVIGVPRKQRRASIWPLLVGIGVLVLGFWMMKLVVNLNRLKTSTPTFVGVPETPAPPEPVESSPATVAAMPSPQAPVPKNPKRGSPRESPAEVASAATPIIAPPAGPQAEVRKAQAVRPQDLANETAEQKSVSPEVSGPNKVDIKPLKSTYIKVVVDNGAAGPVYERWISPSDGTVEFRGQKFAVRVLNREAIQVKKNGKLVTESDSDLTIQ